MPTIKVKKTFKFAERGVDIFEYQEGESVDVSDECAQVAIEAGWADAETGGEPGKKKVKPQPQIIDEDFVQRETAALSPEQVEIK